MVSPKEFSKTCKEGYWRKGEERVVKGDKATEQEEQGSELGKLPL